MEQEKYIGKIINPVRGIRYGYRQGRTTLVRVRRLKYSQYGISDILKLCGQEIKELRELRIPDGIYRELWVRGPDRTWHRYLVLKDGIEPIENEDEPDEGKTPHGDPGVQQP